MNPPARQLQVGDRIRIGGEDKIVVAFRTNWQAAMKTTRLLGPGHSWCVLGGRHTVLRKDDGSAPAPVPAAPAPTRTVAPGDHPAMREAMS